MVKAGMFNMVAYNINRIVAVMFSLGKSVFFGKKIPNGHHIELIKIFFRYLVFGIGNKLKAFFHSEDPVFLFIFRS